MNFLENEDIETEYMYAFIEKRWEFIAFRVKDKEKNNIKLLASKQIYNI